MVAALTGTRRLRASMLSRDGYFRQLGGWQNWISGTDFPPTTTFSFAVPYASDPPQFDAPPFSAGNTTPSGISQFQFARFFNTDPSNATYAWSSPKLYSTDGWANSGTDSFGNYLDLTAGPNGAADNGSFLTASGTPDPEFGNPRTPQHVAARTQKSAARQARFGRQWRQYPLDPFRHIAFPERIGRQWRDSNLRYWP